MNEISIDRKILDLSHEPIISAMAGRLLVKGKMPTLSPLDQEALLNRHIGATVEDVDSAFLVSLINKLGVEFDG